MLFAKIVDILRFKRIIEFAIACNRQSIYRNIASVGRLKPSNKRQQGRFAAARSPLNTHRFTCLYSKVKVVDERSPCL